MAPPGQRHAYRIEQRAFDEHGACVLVAAVASPPITPASDCTPAASAITQSSGVTV